MEPREIITRLAAYDRNHGGSITLQPGTVVTSWQVERSPLSCEPYTVAFSAAGHLYFCPLFRFLPRTRVLEPVPEVEVPVRRTAVL